MRHVAESASELDGDQVARRTTAGNEMAAAPKARGHRVREYLIGE